MHFVRFLCKVATKAVDSDVVVDEVTVVSEGGVEEEEEVDLFLFVKSDFERETVISLLE